MTNQPSEESSPRLDSNASSLVDQAADGVRREIVSAAHASAQARGDDEVTARDVNQAMARLSYFQFLERVLADWSSALRFAVVIATMAIASGGIIYAVGAITMSSALGVLTAINLAAGLWSITWAIVRRSGRQTLELHRKSSEAISEYLEAEARFLSSWRKLEQSLYSRVSRDRKLDYVSRPLGLVISEYASLASLPPDELDELRELVSFRNKLVHASDRQPTREALRAAQAIADKFIHQIGQAHAE